MDKNQLMACYWPSHEPAIVIVLKELDQDDFWVEVANRGTLTGAKREFLKPFCREEFNRALDVYRANRYAALAAEYADKINSLEANDG